MSANALFGMLNATVLAAFGIPATFTPQDGSGAQQITGIIQSPAMGEDRLPGAALGAAVFRLFVQFTTITPAPRHGDVLERCSSRNNCGALVKLPAPDSGGVLQQ